MATWITILKAPNYKGGVEESEVFLSAHSLPRTRSRSERQSSQRDDTACSGSQDGQRHPDTCKRSASASEVPGLPKPGRSPVLTSPIRSDCSQFHSQRVASFSVVLDRVVVAAAAVKVAPTAEDGSVCHVQPQVLLHVTLAALPATIDKDQRKRDQRENIWVLPSKPSPLLPTAISIV